VRGHVWAPQTKVRRPDRLARYVARRSRAPYLRRWALLIALAAERALRGHVQVIQRRARGHEQTVAIGAAEGDIRAALGQIDAPDELALGIEDVDPIEPFLPHPPPAPEVAVHVTAEAVGRAGAGVDELALVGGSRAAVRHVVGENGAWRRSPFDDVELGLVGREREAIRARNV